MPRGQDKVVISVYPDVELHKYLVTLAAQRGQSVNRCVLDLVVAGIKQLLEPVDAQSD